MDPSEVDSEQPTAEDIAAVRDLGRTLAIRWAVAAVLLIAAGFVALMTGQGLIAVLLLIPAAGCTWETTRVLQGRRRLDDLEHRTELG